LPKKKKKKKKNITKLAHAEERIGNVALDREPDRAAARRHLVQGHPVPGEIAKIMVKS
jgi:hypothetical protein